MEVKEIKWVDLLYKMVIAVKCVYNKPVFDFLNMIKLIENLYYISVGISMAGCVRS